MATIREIAEQVGVSITTVSRVLNKDESIMVSEQVKNKIFEVSHQLNYLPPKQRRRKVTNGIIIGIADWKLLRTGVNNTQYSFYQMISQRFSKTAVEFVSLEMGKEAKVDGIIAFGTFDAEEMLFLQKLSYTILFVDSEAQDFEYDRIMIDYYHGLEQTLRYIIEEKGYSSVGYLGGIYQEKGRVIGKTRLSSIAKILMNHDIYQKEYFYLGDMTEQSGYQLMKEAILKECLPKAMIFGNEEMAVGALKALKEHDYSIPEKMGVVIYRDIQTTNYDFTDFDTLKMIPDFMWETAIKMVLEKIKGERTESMRVVLTTKLMKGNSL